MASKKSASKTTGATQRGATKKPAAKPRSVAKKSAQEPPVGAQATHAALIRGINVGRDNALPMSVLGAFFVDAGCSDVRTYIQSGNVVFHASESALSGLPKRIGKKIAQYLERDADVSVIIRSRAELDRAIGENPYPGAAAAPKTVHVGFLEDTPSAEKIARLDVNQSPTDRFTVRGRELYLYTPEGLGKSKLTMAFFAKLGTPCTMRNWNTVLKLQSMLTI